MKRRLPWFLTAYLILAVIVTLPSRAEEIRENEPLVMRLIFVDCLGYLRHGRTPFEGLATRPASEAAAMRFPAAMPNRNQIVELLSPRYAAAWGADGNGRHCIVQTTSDPWPPQAPALLGVQPKGFVARVTARAAEEGLTQHPDGGEFSPLVIPTWSEPESGHDVGSLRPIRIVVAPTINSGNGSLVDAGLIVTGGPPQGRP